MSEDDTTGDEIDDDAATQLLGDGEDPEPPRPDAAAPDAATAARFTQADIDRVVADRLARAARKYADYADLKTKATRLDELELAGRSETERRAAELDSYRARAASAETSLQRRDAAEACAPDHATPAQIRAVAKRVTGDTPEAMEADAAELFALLAPPPARAVPARPKERLRGGADPEEEPEEMDPRKLAALVRGSRK